MVLPIRGILEFWWRNEESIMLAVAAGMYFGRCLNAVFLQTHRHRKQIYTYQRGKGMGEG